MGERRRGVEGAGREQCVTPRTYPHVRQCQHRHKPGILLGNTCSALSLDPHTYLALDIQNDRFFHSRRPRQDPDPVRPAGGLRVYPHGIHSHRLWSLPGLGGTSVGNRSDHNPNHSAHGAHRRRQAGSHRPGPCRAEESSAEERGRRR